jgi:hypothetical protein
MTKAIDHVLADRRLLGAGLGPLASWSVWGTTLKASFARPLDDGEMEVFHTIAGDRSPPAHRVNELWCICGRGSGKSRVAAAVSIYLALFVKYKLAPGERGMCLVIAGTVDQARVVFDYIDGFLTASSALAREVVSRTRSEIRLRCGITIAVHPNSFRSVRGRTLVACVFDETAYWRDETSATPDTEVYTAVLPGLARTGGMLVAISTPYRKIGLLYQKFRDSYAHDEGNILVVQGPSKVFNPTLKDSVISAQRAADPTGSGAEWDAIFRDDLSSFLDEASIDAAIQHGRPLELPPREGVAYFVFVDMSGGRHDLSTIAVVHSEGEGDDRRYVADVMRGRKGDPRAAVKEFVELAKSYHCTVVTGDNYGAEWVAGAYREAGADYLQSKLVRSELYLAGLPLFTTGVVGIPNLAPLVRELRLLERRTARSGRDVVDHGPGGSDDHANAVFGALHLAASVPVYREPAVVVPFVGSAGPRYYPGSSEFTGAGVPTSSSTPAGSYDYNRDDSWKGYVNPDGSIRSTPRGGWGFP